MNSEPKPSTSEYNQTYHLPSDIDIEQKLETERFVKEAPHFVDQIKEDRPNLIVYVKGSDEPLLLDASHDNYRQSREEITEGDALRDLDVFFETVKRHLPQYTQYVQLMRDNLTYIGEQEYKEAAAGIAGYWKSLLKRDPNLQLFPLTGFIAEDNKAPSDDEAPVKSDDYLLEAILSNFTDEELSAYTGRLIVDAKDITADSDNLRVVLIDDWTVSGGQLGSSFARFSERHPHPEDSVEVQLIAANEDILKQGVMVLTEGGRQEFLPTTAYFKAHSSEAGQPYGLGDYTTGSHSSVDFDFEYDIAVLTEDLQSVGLDVTMPPPTNIVRPYRNGTMTRESLVQRQRVKRT